MVPSLLFVGISLEIHRFQLGEIHAFLLLELLGLLSKAPCLLVAKALWEAPSPMAR